MLLVTGCGEKKEKLILATEAGFAPYEYYSNGEIVGVDIDIAKKIAEELNMDLVIKDVAFDSIISEVKTEKSSLGAAGISFTEGNLLSPVIPARTGSPACRARRSARPASRRYRVRAWGRRRRAQWTRRPQRCRRP